MFRKLTNILIITIFSLGLFVFANTSFNIDDNFFLESGVDTGSYSILNFSYGGNNFDGVLFLGTGLSQTGQLTLSGITIDCDKQVNGFYINTARGNKGWPIDQQTLIAFSGSTNLSGYENLTITGGFFTQCTGTNIENNKIYGYIKHSYMGNDYEMWAGIEYNFTGNTAIANWSGTMDYITGSNITSEGYVFDNHGGIAKVYSNTSLYGNATFTGSNISLSGTEYITYDTGIQVSIYSNIDADYLISGDIVSNLSGTMSGGIYDNKNVLLTNNTGTKNIEIMFSTGSENFQKNISLNLLLSGSTTSGDTTPTDTTDPIVTLTYPSNGTTLSTNSINFQWSGNDDIAIDYFDLYINGNSTSYSRTNINNNSRIVSSLPNDTYSWYVVATDTSGNTGQSIAYNLTLNNPSIGPNLIDPSSGANIVLGNLELERSDTSSQSGYLRQISTNTGFTNIISSGTVSNTGVGVFNNPDFMTGLFYWRVSDIESSAISNYKNFVIIEPSGGLDLEVDEFDFDREENAELGELYESNEITIDGLTDGVYIKIELENGIGALFINDIMVGTEGLVKNGDNIYIEMISSNDYDELVYTNLIIGDGDNEVSDKFRIYTKSDDKKTDLVLSYGQKLQAIFLVETLADMYGDSEVLQQFFVTFKAMLRDKMDELEYDINKARDNTKDILKSKKASIEYLYDTIDKYLSNMLVENRSVYIAPNGKQYIVEYSQNRLAYTSPDFMYEKHFPTRKLFTSHININNPGDGVSIDQVGETVITPNNKVYRVKTENGKWTSDNMQNKKYFDTRSQLVNYLYANNPSDVWDHRIDTNFDVVKHVAPNGRQYNIFKTSNVGNNSNKYSSFNFVTPKYFDSLQATKNHITMYNK